MDNDSIVQAAKAAGAAAAMGAVARLAVAARDGARGVRLLLEGFVGACLGIVAAAAALWVDPSLRADGWPLLITSGFAGLAGAMGSRGLDLLSSVVERWLKK